MFLIKDKGVKALEKNDGLLDRNGVAPLSA